MTARIAVELKLFELIVAKGGPISASELASSSGAEQLLIGKFF